MNARTLLIGATSFLFGHAALAQAPIAGLNLRGADRVFSSSTGSIVADYINGANLTPGREILALDFDADAIDLWAIDFATSEYGRVNLATGAFLSIGASTLPPSFANGMTAAPDGDTWYVVGQQSGNFSQLWAGDVQTGTFSLVGTISAAFIIEIACDSQGNLYGLSLVNDALYSINTTTGLGSFRGAHGIATDFAQGLDFDWTTDTLYAGLYEGGGVGTFCSLDTADGSVLTSMPTNALNAQLKFSVQVPASGGPIGSNNCVTHANSVGLFGEISANGSLDPAGDRVTLRASLLPPGQFGMFVGSMMSGFVPSGGGTSNGNICLGGVIGRFDRPGEIRLAAPDGAFSLELDLTAIPQGNGTVSIMSGESWYFQAWHRDSVGLGSNFTRGLRLDFQ